MDGVRSVRVGMVLLMLMPATAGARPLHMVGSPPAPQIYMVGRNTQYVVRFDGPVDHNLSRLFITRGDQVIETLPPSHDAEVNVLAAGAPRLPAGAYVLHWVAKSLPDGEETDGSSQFSMPQ